MEVDHVVATEIPSPQQEPAQSTGQHAKGNSPRKPDRRKAKKKEKEAPQSWGHPYLKIILKAREFKMDAQMTKLKEQCTRPSTGELTFLEEGIRALQPKPSQTAPGKRIIRKRANVLHGPCFGGFFECCLL